MPAPPMLPGPGLFIWIMFRGMLRAIICCAAYWLPGGAEL
jgi:hypothetical protein